MDLFSRTATRGGWRGTPSAALVLVLLAVSLGGCLSAGNSERGPRPTILNPRWQDAAFARHLGFFGNAFQGGATPASAPVGDYVSAVLQGAWIQPALEGRYRLRPLYGRPSGYLGYVGGKHPPVAEEAVLVCADFSGASTAAEAAALLEVARVYGTVSQYTLMPERSVIFALWPTLGGEGEVAAGLRAYLRRPTWSLDAVRAVLYVSLPDRSAPELRALLEDEGIALHRVTVQPAAADPAQAAPADDRADDRADDPAAAVARARRLADRTHRRLRALTLTSGDVMPSLGDTLYTPAPGTLGERP